MIKTNTRMEKLNIFKDDDPERYGFISGEYIILCQIESDDYTLSVVKSRNGKRAAYKAEVLYEGNNEDFCMEYNGYIGDGQFDVEIAFKNFIIIKILKIIRGQKIKTIYSNIETICKVKDDYVMTYENFYNWLHYSKFSII